MHARLKTAVPAEVELLAVMTKGVTVERHVLPREPLVRASVCDLLVRNSCMRTMSAVVLGRYSLAVPAEFALTVSMAQKPFLTCLVSLTQIHVGAVVGLLPPRRLFLLPRGMGT